ncbi:MAG: prepilin-type N-terminal cleavage/methylation domain-containing protein [Gemmatimonadetes bacterium]|nr:prepilin-type N-terminal cleavage/methylation domain-containing protein [Gemmatimonadota bacterium]
MSDTRGFTITEVVIAIVILSVGILGLAGTAASVTRMVGRSQQDGKTASLASERFEILRSLNCTAVAGGSSTSGQYSVTWSVTDVTNGKQATIMVTGPTATGTRSNTFTQIISCVN